MESLALKINQALSEVGIKTPNDFKRIKFDIESLERGLQYGVEGLNPIFQVWIIALRANAGIVPEIESLILKDPFLEKFGRISFDRINEIILLHHDGVTFHIIKDGESIKIKMDEV